MHSGYAERPGLGRTLQFTGHPRKQLSDLLQGEAELWWA